MERYDLTWDGLNFAYEFYSEGPNGRIKKGISFQHMQEIGSNVFNLAFGDVDESTGRIDDRAISNNNDQIKVLNTVAITVIDFLEKRPNVIVLMQGSTLSRTRLYQMRISFHWLTINQYCEVYGEKGKEWLPFEKGLNYERFLVFKKSK